VVHHAKIRGLAAISITDHDTLAGLAEARAVAGADLEILTGVEVTALFRDREVHLLGYGFDEMAHDLLAHFERSRIRRRERMQAMIQRLRECGVEVTFEEVQAVVGPRSSMGRLHLAEVLVQKQAVHSLSEAFERYLGDDAPCFVKSTTWTVPQAVQAIRGAGGIAVLAHPHRLVQDPWLPELVAMGVEGIEVYHSEHPPHAVEHYLKVAERLGLIITGGSDCHGLAKANGPLIGTVPVPYSIFEKLKESIACRRAGG